MARFSVEFPDDTNGVIENLARQRGATKTEILRRALAAYKVLTENAEDNVVTVTRDGKEKSFILP